jgi:hypothetical protein
MDQKFMIAIAPSRFYTGPSLVQIQKDTAPFFRNGLQR